jgi:hypothetical protein
MKSILLTASVLTALFLCINAFPKACLVSKYHFKKAYVFSSDYTRDQVACIRNVHVWYVLSVTSIIMFEFV